MLHEIFGYMTHHVPAFFWGVGIGLMLGAVIVGIGAARQYMKGREDGYDEGMIKGKNDGWRHGYEKGVFVGKAQARWEGGLHVVRKSDRLP